MTRKEIEKRIILCAQYYVTNLSTVRKTAKEFNISKTTVHDNLSKDLKYLDSDLYYEVRRLLNKNKLEASLRGGLSTKRKYYLLKNNK